MATKLNGRLTLTKIPKGLIQSATDKEGNTQKFIYVDIVPNRDGADQYGNTHSIQVYDKETKKVHYLGNLKPQDFGGGKQGGNACQKKEEDDLPFSKRPR